MFPDTILEKRYDTSWKGCSTRITFLTPIFIVQDRRAAEAGAGFFSTDSLGTVQKYQKGKL